MTPSSGVIELDWTTGRIKGAGAVERLGLAATVAASRILSPLDDFGFSYAARGIAAALPSRKAVRMRFPDGESVDFPYGDRYWSVLLPRRRRYEAGVEAALERLADEPFVFVDCGANYGYWSVRVSGGGFGRHEVLAIEAAPDTFLWLERNAALNEGRFSVLHRAVGATTGEVVQIRGAKHEARTTVGDAGASIGAVETIALDTLLEREGIRDAARIVLKLDVEGAEIAALEGGRRMLERDVLIIYEDHGDDPSHEVSTHLKRELGMRLFTPGGGGVRELGELDELDAIKTNRRWGYELFATRSAFWVERLARLGRR